MTQLPTSPPQQTDLPDEAASFNPADFLDSPSVTQDGTTGQALTPASPGPLVDPQLSESALRILRPASAALFNFDGEPLRRWQLASLATGASCGDGSAEIDKPFQLRYWYIHEVELEDDETKDTFKALRVVLFDQDCRCFAFVSDGIAKSVMGLVQIFGNKPIDPPITVVIREIKTNKGRRYYVLEPSGM